MTDQPFAGLEVVEFGQFVAVPWCAQLFADGGAHVIKVEPHEGDPTRVLAPLAPGETRHFLSRNRGKHSLPLDLRHAMAPHILDALLSRAEVAFFNLRPGLGAELGLDFATLASRYPRLITGNVTAFGKEGPDRMLAGMDYVVQARSGLMASLGKVTDGLPSAGDSPVVDYMCAALLAFGVSSALYRRERSGRGGEVDVSLLGAAMGLQATLFTRVASADAAPDAELLSWLAEARAEGLPFAEQLKRNAGVRPSYMSTVYYRTYATRNSAIGVACGSPSLRRKFMAATGMEDPLLGKDVPREEMAKHYAALQLLMEARLGERTTADWQAALDRAGVPASRVVLPVELLADEQTRLNGLIYDFDHPAVGRTTLLGPPIQLDGVGFRPGPPSAAFASETRAILAGIGLSGEEIERAVADGAVRATEA